MSRSRSRPETPVPLDWPLQRCDRGDYDRRRLQVPISSDQGHLFVDRDHHEPGLFLKNEIWRRTRHSTTSRRRWISFLLGLSKMYQHPQSPSRKKVVDHPFSGFRSRLVLSPHHHEHQASYILCARQAKRGSNWWPLEPGQSYRKPMIAKKSGKKLDAEKATQAGWMGTWMCCPTAASKRTNVFIPLKVACIVIEARRLLVRW